MIMRFTWLFGIVSFFYCSIVCGQFVERQDRFLGTVEDFSSITAQKVFLKGQQEVKMLPGFRAVASDTKMQDLRAFVDPHLVLGTSYNINPGVISAVNLTGEVGKIPGTLSVEQGAANYMIPFDLPPGTNGLVPTIGLAYSSMGGNGFLGMGWSLIGMSSITRANKNFHYDGQVSRYDLLEDGNEFLLDGQRLLFESATQLYKKQADDFSEIRKVNSSSGSYSFEVKMRNGLTYFYGQTANSREAGLTMASQMAWHLDKIQDLNGNYITFEYASVEDAINKRIKRIRYTGNDKIGLQAYNSIEFYYDARYDGNLMLRHNNKARLSELLRQVAIKCGDNVVWMYNLTYTLESQVSCLKAVTKVNSENKSINATQFAWLSGGLEKTGSHFTVESKKIYNSPLDQPVIFGWSKKHHLVHGDFTGDGMADVLFVEVEMPSDQKYSKATRWRLYKSTGNDIQWKSQAEIPRLSESYEDDYSLSNSYHEYPLSGDFNGDGLHDFAIVKIESPAKPASDYSEVQRYCVRVFYNNGSSGFVESIGFEGYSDVTSDQLVHTGDFDGDKATDLFLRKITNRFSSEERYSIIQSLKRNATKDAPPNEEIYYGGKIKVIDYEGDGKSELLTINPTYQTTKVQTFLPENKTLQHTGYPGYPNEHHDFYTGDFNGDGLCDYLIKPNYNNDWKIAYNFDRNNYYQEIPFQAFQEYRSDDKVYLEDFNGDGYTDILRATTEEGRLALHFVFFFGFNRWEARYYTTGISRHDLYMADFNGDGVLDIMNRDGFGEAHLLFVNSFLEPPKISQFVDGFGNFATITYNLTSNTQIYSENYENFTSDPLTKARPNLRVVSEVYTHSPNGIANFERFKYKNLVVHNQGFGALGFMQVERSFNSNDPNFDSPFTEISEYSLNTYLYKLEKTSTTIIGKNGTPSSRSERFITWDESNFFSTRPVYKVNQIVERKEDFLANISSSSKMAFYFDGSLIFEHQKTGESEKTIYYSENVLAGRQILPGKIRAVYHNEDNPDFEQTTILKYNAANGQIIEKIANVGKPETVKENFDYYETGNLKTRGLTGDGINEPRLEHYKYDEKFRQPTLILDGFNQGTLTRYDFRFGKPTLILNKAGQVTRYKYDNWGRLIENEGPTGVKTKIYYEWANTAYNPQELYKIRTITDGAPEEIVFYDKMGREVKTTTTDYYGNVIKATTEYTATGQVKNQTNTHRGDVDKLVSDFQYDEFLRPIKQTITGLTPVLTQFSGLQKSVISPLRNETMVHRTDGVLESIHDGIAATQYTKYHPLGMPTQLEAPGKLITMEYDEYGLQKTLNDPDAGVTSYKYNSFGEITEQRDAKGNLYYGFKYDRLGRVLEKVQKDGETGDELRYVYEYYLLDGEKGLGQLKSVAIPGHSTHFEYDEFGRLIKQKEQINNKHYTWQFTYDKFNRMVEERFPSGYTIERVFNEKGYLIEIREKNTGKIIWKLLDLDTQGRVVRSERFGGLITENSYDKHGFPTFRRTKKGTGILFDLLYEWDPNTAQLLSRTDQSIQGQPRTERFKYDNDRLTEVRNGSGALMSRINFDTEGASRIKFKTGVGSLNYGDNAYPVNAVKYIDALGTDVPESTQELSYTPFNSTKQIKEGIYQLDIQYGHHQQRVSSTLIQGGLPVYTKTFLGNYEEHQQGAFTKKIHYVSGPDGLIGIYVQDSDPTKQPVFYNAEHDYLGSITALSNESGAVVYRQSFDAWGRRRNANTWDYETTQTTAEFGWVRGYTGHEHLDEFGLINMNGRIYDPLLGLMLSPDNFVSDATSTVAYNRFLYANGNPMKYTDPSGEFIFALVGFIVAGGADLLSGNWQGWKGSGQPALMAGLMGLMTPFGGEASEVLQYGLSALANRFVPSISVYQSENFSLSVSPMIGFGSSGLTAGGSLNASGKSGDFVWNASVSAGYNSGMSSLGEAAGGSSYLGLGGFAGYNDGHANYGLGLSTTWFGGNTAQRVGAITAQMGDFGLRIDEDFFPVIGDREDRYRTGGLLATYKVSDDLTLAFGGSMITGEPGGTMEGGNPNVKRGFYDSCQERCYNLRGGTMYGGIIYKGQSYFVGHNSEKRLHDIQNYIHRNVTKTSPYFEDRMFKSRAYSYYGGYNPYYLYY